MIARYLLSLATLCLSVCSVHGQALTHQISPAEAAKMPAYRAKPPISSNAITTPPAQAVRASAEWEEIDGIMVTWTSYPVVLTEIVRNARLETTVYIVTQDSNAVKNTLQTANVPPSNIRYVDAAYDRVWARDYGQWNVYTNDVDSLLLIDWIYNRPRPADDTVPASIARMTGLPLYTMTQAPNDLVHTGGNFMVDGFGTGFSSKLILDENTGKTEAQIDNIMSSYLGLTRYIKMNTLPYDGIHHIDMHIKLLDEQTLLVGQFPTGLSDGPQLEANLLSVLTTYNSHFGTPYKIVRIPMPPSVSGLYTPDADYRTYTNSVFINKTILVPTYREEYDTTALKIYRKALPGYKVVGINAEGMISASGALHCITKEVASNSQLLISHQPLETSTNTGSRTVNAFIKHKTGIQGATLYYRTDTTQPYATAPMTASANNQFSAAIPGYPLGTTVYYYIGATATNGKTMNRPMPGPAGAWRYDVSNPLSVPSCVAVAEMQDLFPNPGKGIVCVPVNAMVRSAMKMEVIDAKGSVMKAQPEKEIAVGETLHFFNASEWPSGIYFVRMTVGTNVSFQKFVRE